ncbi:MAG: ABC transporter permease subunit [Thermoplasmata archaeon]
MIAIGGHGVISLPGGLLSSSHSTPAPGAPPAVGLGISPTPHSSYSVLFLETGLVPPSTSVPFWSVTLNGSTFFGVNSRIAFSEPNGSYPFTAQGPAGHYASPASGNITVNGNSVEMLITFTTGPPSQYSVQFSESGLPTGTSWSVSVGAVTNSSTGTAIGFSLENNSYSCQIEAPGGWIATPVSGTLNVTGASVLVQVHFTPAPPPNSPSSSGFLGLPGLTGYYLLAALAGGMSVAVTWGYVRLRGATRISPLRSRFVPAATVAEGLSGSGETARKTPRGSAFVRFAMMRLALIPTQLVFILWILYLAIDVPPQVGRITTSSFFGGFAQMVTNIFTGNWGFSHGTFNLPWFQLYLDLLPTSLQVALFALPIAAVAAYYVGLKVGWSRSSIADLPVRLGSLTSSMVSVVVIGLVVDSVFFLAYVHWFNDLPGFGLIPSRPWFETYGGGYPSWIIYGQITRPTGLPLVDGLVHQAWQFEAMTVMKTLIQGIVVAIVYLAVFVRHARGVVSAASDELHLQAARSRGVSERTLLWKHTARRVGPTFLLVFALTIPAYLATQFVVEAVFMDPGIGELTVGLLANGGSLVALEGMIFLLSAFVLVSVYLVDLYAVHLDPRGAVRR